ncbi:hypothetical protein VTN02DRAFT_3001 [Thermoascus thermophilus]
MFFRVHGSCHLRDDYGEDTRAVPSSRRRWVPALFFPEAVSKRRAECERLRDRRAGFKGQTSGQRNHRERPIHHRHRHGAAAALASASFCYYGVVLVVNDISRLFVIVNRFVCGSCGLHPLFVVHGYKYICCGA